MILYQQLHMQLAYCRYVFTEELSAAHHGMLLLVAWLPQSLVTVVPRKDMQSTIVLSTQSHACYRVWSYECHVKCKPGCTEYYIGSTVTCLLYSLGVRCMVLVAVEDVQSGVVLPVV